MNKIAISFIGIGQHAEEKADRTNILKQDRANIKLLIKQIPQIQPLNTINIDKNSWTDGEVHSALHSTRQTLIKDEHHAYISVIVSHGDSHDTNGIIKTSNKQNIAYNDIKSYFRNDSDMPQSAKYRPRLVIFYACKGPMKTRFDDNENNINTIWQVHGNKYHFTTGSQHNQYPAPNTIPAQVNSLHFDPFENVYFIEAASSYNPVSSFPHGTAAIMSMSKYLRNNNIFSFSHMAETIRREIQLLHRCYYGVHISPVYSTPKITNDGQFTLIKSTYTLSSQQQTFVSSINNLISKADNESKTRQEDAMKTKTFLDNKLRIYIPHYGTRFIFKSLSKFQRFVSFTAFLNHFETQLLAEKKEYVKQVIGDIFSITSLEHLISDIRYKWGINDNDDIDYDMVQKRAIDAIVFDKIYNIYDQLFQLITHPKLKQLVVNKKIFYIPRTLDEIEDHIESLNDMDIEGRGMNEICEFKESPATNDTMLLLVPVEDDSFCGFVLVHKVKESNNTILKINTFLNEQVYESNEMNSNGIQSNQPSNLSSYFWDKMSNLNGDNQGFLNILKTLCSSSTMDLHYKYLDNISSNIGLFSSYDNFLTQQISKMYGFSATNIEINKCKKLLHHMKFNWISEYLKKRMVKCFYNIDMKNIESLDIIKDFLKRETLGDKIINVLLLMNVTCDDINLIRVYKRDNKSDGAFDVRKIENSNWFKSLWDKKITSIGLFIDGEPQIYPKGDKNNNKNNNNNNNKNNNCSNSNQNEFYTSCSVDGANDTFGDIEINMAQERPNKPKRNINRIRRNQRRQKLLQQKMDLDYSSDNSGNDIDMDRPQNKVNRKRKRDDNSDNDIDDRHIEPNRKKNKKNCLFDNGDNDNPDGDNHKIINDYQKKWLCFGKVTDDSGNKINNCQHYHFVKEALKDANEMAFDISTLYFKKKSKKEKKKKWIDKFDEKNNVWQYAGFYLLVKAIEESDYINEDTDDVEDSDLLRQLPDWRTSWSTSESEQKKGNCFRFSKTWTDDSDDKMKCKGFINFCRRIGTHFYMFPCPHCLKRYKKMDSAIQCINQHCMN